MSYQEAANSGRTSPHSSCQRCGAQAPDGNDWCEPCEQADGARVLAVLRSFRNA